MSLEGTHLPVLHPRDTAFSYRCRGCNRCCHDKRIQVNPYEIARLARNAGTTTTDLIARFTVGGGTALATRADGGCVFLGPEGCTVHRDRPLVCRLYPLGRVVYADGREVFVENEPHPETEGIYGRDGTIDSYLATQGVAPFIAAADWYYSLLQQLMESSPSLSESGDNGEGSENSVGITAAMVVDADLAVGNARRSSASPSSLPDADELMELHLAVLRRRIRSELTAPHHVDARATATGRTTDMTRL